ncbi:MAG: DUF3791 domain-containing protein [Dysgonamonadaceae bacterium]|jgi:hypothetical protein|nr:DUF3791 domain-containing protein [Dysgonamonadaceae bacterium]
MDKTASQSDKEASDRIGFITYIIPKFADEFRMNRHDAYLYLKKYGGIDYIFQNWWALHTDNPFWAVRDIHEICYRNGGWK